MPAINFLISIQTLLMAYHHVKYPKRAFPIPEQYQICRKNPPLEFKDRKLTILPSIFPFSLSQ